MSTEKKKKRWANEVAEKACQPIKDIEPKPSWVQALMILLLHKNGGSLTVSLGDLERFEALESDNETQLTFDKVRRTVTITAPEMIMPDKKLVVPDKTIIDGSNII